MYVCGIVICYLHSMINTIQGINLYVAEIKLNNRENRLQNRESLSFHST